MPERAAWGQRRKVLEMLVFNYPVVVAMFPIEAKSRPALVDFKAKYTSENICSVL